MTRPLGKDPIPSNTEDLTKHRQAHPQPVRGSRASEIGDKTRQTAEDSWQSAKGQTREAVEDVKGEARGAADGVKGKYRETADKVKGKSRAAADDVENKASETADDVKGWTKNWFGEFDKHLLHTLMQS